MENKTAVTSFIFAAFTELEDHRYLYSACLLLLYIMILLSNSILIFVIYNDSGLHEPMYIFLCNLSVNSVYVSSIFLPSLLKNLLSKNYEILVEHCLLQTYSLYVAAIVEYTCLAVMAYDRYVAICHPLHYHLLMPPKKVYIAIALSWVIPFIYFALYFISVIRLTFCDRHIHKVFCSTVQLETLACFDTSVQRVVGMSLIAVCPGIPFALILFSYAQILRICIFASRESQLKALQTCTPHLATMINYTVGVLFELTQSSFDMSHVSYRARIFMSLYLCILPSLFNPIIYGMSIQAVRVQVFKLFVGK